MATSYLSPGVYVEEVDKGPKPIEGVGTAIAAFIGFAEQGPVGEPTLITSWTQFTGTFGSFVKGTYLALSVYGWFNNGGTVCYVTRLPGVVGSGGASSATAATAALPSRSSAALPSLDVTAVDAGADVTVEVRAAEGGADDSFTFVARRGSDEEVFPNVTLSKGRNARNVVEVVNKESKLVRLAEREMGGTLAERAPAVGSYALATVSTSVPAIPEISTRDIIGDASERTGINGLEVLDIVTMVAVPDVMAAYQAGRISEEGVRAVQTALMDHCAGMQDRVAIIDPMPGMKPQQVRDWRMNVANYDSKYAALYYPWIKVANPIGNGDGVLVPPSGHLAGIWARNDAERGVHKAPANEVVRGAIGLEFQISRNEQDTLNPVGINCIRAFPGRGIRVWGARTLSSDPAWRYLNVRRLFNFIEKSIENGTQWVVFEPNNYDLWARIKRDLRAFLVRNWRDGALFGQNPSEAFYVKCDAELNTAEVRDAGQVIVEIGLAPVKPAEFVIFRISQFAAGGGVEE